MSGKLISKNKKGEAIMVTNIRDAPIAKNQDMVYKLNLYSELIQSMKKF